MRDFKADITGGSFLEYFVAKKGILSEKDEQIVKLIRNPSVNLYASGVL